MTSKLPSRSRLLAVLLFLFPLFVQADIHLVVHEPSQELDRHEQICIRGYEESYASVDLNILRATSLDEYSVRVFKKAVSDPIHDTPQTIYLVDAYDDESNQVVGFAAFIEQEPHSYFLNLIVVDPAHQQQQIGTRLLFSIIDIDPDLTLLQFDARKLNERAVSWYQRLGFQDDPTAIHHPAIFNELLGFRMEFMNGSPIVPESL